MQNILEHHTDKKLPTLQVLRGVAASLVVFHHFSSVIGEHSVGRSFLRDEGFGELGRHGVDIFFVISGFIMAYTASRKSGLADAVVFLYRRAIRVYPLYWIWMAVLMVMLKVLPTSTKPVSRLYLLKSALLIPVSDGTVFRPLLAQGWTLSFELLFYFVFALCIALTIIRFRLAALCVGFGALAALGLLLPPTSGARFLIDNPLIAEFLFGVVAALILAFLRKRTQGHPSPTLAWFLVTAGFVAMIAMRNTFLPELVAFGIPSFLLVLGTVLFGSRPRPSLGTFLGDASYSIYLTHGFFMLAFQFAYKHVHGLKALPVDPTIVITTVLVVAISSTSYLLVERPLMHVLQTKRSPRHIA